MKKRFLFPVITSLALLFALTGCNTPISDVKLDVDETENVNNPALPGPANVKADAHEGIIIVTWNQVKDAQKYQLYRRDNEKGVVKELTSTTKFYYVDIVSPKNQLVDKRSYTYTVVSVSGKSPNTRAVITQEDVIWNGQSSDTAAAKIPDRSKNAELDWIKAPAPAEVGFVHHEGGDFGKDWASNVDSITWPVKPNLSYTAVLQYGSEPTGYIGKALPIYFPLGDDDDDEKDNGRGDGPYDPLGYAYFPSIGGTNTIKITTTFIDGGEYYTKVDPVTIPIVAAKYTVIPAPTNFAADRLNDTNIVQLQWKEVKEAKAYSVYRIEYTVAGDYETYVGPWVKITTTGDESKGGVHFAKDTADVTKSYQYFVVAENTALDAKSYPSDLKKLETIEVPQPADFKVQLLEAAYGDAQDKGVQISWTQGSLIPYQNVTDVYDKDVTYELSRAVIEYNTSNGVWDNTNSYHVVGQYTPITVPTAQLEQGKVYVTETIPATATATSLKERTYYVYKLVQKKGGVSSDPVYAELRETGAFSKYVNLKLSANADPEVDEHGKVTLRLANEGSRYLGDITAIRLYRRDLYNGDPEKEYKEINTGATKWTTIAKTGAPSTLLFVDTDVKITGDNTRYQYKAVAIGVGGKEVLNASTHEIKTGAAVANVGNFTTNSIGNAQGIPVLPAKVTLTFTSKEYLSGNPAIKVEYRSSNANDFPATGTWTAATTTTLTGAIAKKEDANGTYYTYEFPDVNFLVTNKYYQIRVSQNWTPESGSPNAKNPYINTVTARTGIIGGASAYASTTAAGVSLIKIQFHDISNAINDLDGSIVPAGVVQYKKTTDPDTAWISLQTNLPLNTDTDYGRGVGIISLGTGVTAGSSYNVQYYNGTNYVNANGQVNF